MGDRMDKEAMEKYYSYLKNYYPPSGYPLRHPYYLQPHEEKDRKTPQSYSQMYGYPPSPYSPYQMPPMGYQQHYPMEHDQEKREEDKPKQEMPNPYAHYYPYSPYPYYNPYAYPPYYYAQRDYANKGAPMPPMGTGMSTPHSQHPGNSMYSAVPQVEPSPSAMKILSKQLEKPVKLEIVISSDSEEAHQAPPPHPPAPTLVVTAPPPPLTIMSPPLQTLATLASLIPLLKPTPPPAPTKPERMQQQKPLQKKNADALNMEDQGEQDPFLIRKKQKIAKEEKVKSKALKALPPPERERQINTRYSGMPAQTYQEMIKKQTRMRLELFYQRERQRKQQERSKDHEKQMEKDLISKDIKPEKNEKDEKDQKKSAQDKSEKDKKQKQPTFIPRISAPTVPEELIKRQRERIKDDHPLKELRYNESHGRIRLGAYFQSTIPSLLRHEEVLARKADLQKKLRERQVAAVTF